jgi:hypothetical protein
MKKTLKNTDKYGNIRKKKVLILWAFVLIFFTNHSSYNYSVCHKLLHMQNIYILPSMVIWKLLIIHHVSSLNITTIFPLTSPILLPLSCHRKDGRTWKDNLHSCIIRIVIFCILFNIYVNSHSTTKLNYVAPSIMLLLVSHDTRS